MSLRGTRGPSGVATDAVLTPVLAGLRRRYAIRRGCHMTPFRGTSWAVPSCIPGGDAKDETGEWHKRVCLPTTRTCSSGSRHHNPTRDHRPSHPRKDKDPRPPTRESVPASRRHSSFTIRLPPGRESPRMTASFVPLFTRTGETGDLRFEHPLGHAGAPSAHEDAQPSTRRSPRRDLGIDDGGFWSLCGKDQDLTPPAAATKDARGSSKFSRVVSSRPPTKLVIHPVRIRHLRP